MIELNATHLKWVQTGLNKPKSKIIAKRLHLVHKWIAQQLGQPVPEFNCFCHVRERDQYIDSFYELLNENNISYE